MTPIEQVRESVTHELKCHPEPFQAVKRNEKRFEFRKDDRDYRVGDNLHLREWMPGSGWDNDGGNEGDYTGDECHRRVDYIIREGFGIPKGYCIMSLALLKTMEGEPVAWMEPASKFTMNADMKKALSSGHIKETCEADRFSIPLYASTHTKTITVDEVETLIRLLERSKVGTKFAREYEKKCQPDQEARTGIDFDKDVDAMLFLLRDRLTSKFK